MERITEAELNKDVKIITVVHFEFQSSAADWILKHGIPFTTYITKDDTFKSLCDRLHDRTGLDFEKIQLAAVHDQCSTRIVAKAEDVVCSHEALMKEWNLDNTTLPTLGLEYPNPVKVVRRHEQGIVIRPNC